jgi:hypothetical protein
VSGIREAEVKCKPFLDRVNVSTLIKSAASMAGPRFDSEPHSPFDKLRKTKVFFRLDRPFFLASGWAET